MMILEDFSEKGLPVITSSWRPNLTCPVRSTSSPAASASAAWAVLLPSAAALAIWICGGDMLLGAEEPQPALSPPSAIQKPSSPDGDVKAPNDAKADEAKAADDVKPDEAKAGDNKTGDQKTAPEKTPPSPQPKAVPFPRDVPWSQADPAANLPKEIRSPKELLNPFGIDQSQLDNLLDHQPLEDSQETLVKILMRLPQLGRGAFLEWQKEEVPWEALAAEPAKHRVEAYAFSARVDRVRRVRLSPTVRDNFGFARYFELSCTTANGKPAIVYSREIPGYPLSLTPEVGPGITAAAETEDRPKTKRAWSLDVPIEEPVRVAGLFLRTGADAGKGPAASFVATEILWLPEKADPDRNLRESDLFLASLGYDAALIPQIRHRRKEIEIEPFYALLQALRKTDAAALRSRSVKFDIAALLTTPDSLAGTPMVVEGVAKRVKKIMLAEANDADIRKRYGIDHYYEIDVFVPLPAKVQYSSQKKDKQSSDDSDKKKEAEEEDTPTFQGDYPVVACVLELPPGLEEGKLSRRVRIPAVYFKLWAYQSDYVAKFDKHQRQLGPLFVGVAPEVDPVFSEFSPLTLVAGGLAAFALVGAAFYFFLTSTADRRSRAERRRERELPAGKNLNQILPPTDPPAKNG